MLIENTALNLQEVGDKSITQVKRECLNHFAFYLREFILSRPEPLKTGTINYQLFADYCGSKIKYNSKNIVFEETLYNSSQFSPQQSCKDYYRLKRVDSCTTPNSTYWYEFEPEPKYLEDGCCAEAAECSVPKNRLLEFHKFFGVGEFPYVHITVLRIGNIDHYFYSITR